MEPSAGGGFPAPHQAERGVNSNTRPYFDASAMLPSRNALDSFKFSRILKRKVW